MNKIHIILLSSLMVLSASAAKRSTAQMEQIAHQRLEASAIATQTRTANTSQVRRTLNTPELSVYSDGRHYVIISRDERFQPVLAYGAGVFDPDKLPDGTAWWFAAVQNSLVSPMKSTHKQANKVSTVAPMLTTKWGQWTPYNNYAPIFKKDKTKAPAGCVATAMAQVMNYQQYPASAEFVGSYSVSDDKEQIEAEVSTTYAWPYLDAYNYYFPEGTDEYTKVSNTPRQGNLVAYLMRDCGYAVGMMYNPAGSGAYSMEAAQALIERFKYDEIAVRYYNRTFYSTEEWMDIIYGELEAGCPFIYAGSDANGSGGHAFVADGVDSEGLLHINWGWNGQSDGYYAFDLLNPDDQEYSRGQEIVTGIRPKAIEGDVYGSLVASSTPAEFGYNNETKMFSFKEYGLYNYGGKTIIGDVGIVFENINDPDDTDYIEFMEPGDTLESYYGWREYSDSLKMEFTPGQYKVYFGSKDYREDRWQMARTIGGTYYYDMTVSDTGEVTIVASDQNTETGIHSVPLPGGILMPDQRLYDLHGRYLGTSPDALPKGIYIIGGKKVVK